MRSGLEGAVMSTRGKSREISAMLSNESNFCSLTYATFTSFIYYDPLFKIWTFLYITDNCKEMNIHNRISTSFHARCGRITFTIDVFTVADVRI